LRWGAGQEAVEPDQAALLRDLLAKAGYRHLSVAPARGGLEVEGRLSGDQELAKLVELVKNRPLRTYLRISINSDLVAAVEQSLASYGFYPSVAGLDDGSVEISAYMRDRQVEGEAFARLEGDVPDLKAGRRIVHRAELEPILRRELARQGLQGLGLGFREGWIEILAPPSFAGQEALAEAFRIVRGEAMAPVVYAVATVDDPQAAQAELAAQAAQPAAAAPPQPGPGPGPEPGPEPRGPDNPLGSLVITGVGIGPMSFVSTADGHRLFEGSLLPGGWTIERIESGALTLVRGGETMTSPLGDP
jgi:type III secretion protein D